MTTSETGRSGSGRHLPSRRPLPWRVRLAALSGAVLSGAVLLHTGYWLYVAGRAEAFLTAPRNGGSLVLAAPVRIRGWPRHFSTSLGDVQLPAELPGLPPGRLVFPAVTLTSPLFDPGRVTVQPATGFLLDSAGRRVASLRLGQGQVRVTLPSSGQTPAGPGRIGGSFRTLTLGTFRQDREVTLSSTGELVFSGEFRNRNGQRLRMRASDVILTIPGLPWRMTTRLDRVLADVDLTDHVRPGERVRELEIHRLDAVAGITRLSGRGRFLVRTAQAPLGSLSVRIRNFRAFLDELSRSGHLPGVVVAGIRAAIPDLPGQGGHAGFSLEASDGLLRLVTPGGLTLPLGVLTRR